MALSGQENTEADPCTDAPNGAAAGDGWVMGAWTPESFESAVSPSVPPEETSAPPEGSDDGDTGSGEAPAAQASPDASAGSEEAPWADPEPVAVVPATPVPEASSAPDGSSEFRPPGPAHPPGGAAPVGFGVGSFHPGGPGWGHPPGARQPRPLHGRNRRDHRSAPALPTHRPDPPAGPAPRRPRARPRVRPPPPWLSRCGRSPVWWRSWIRPCPRAFSACIRRPAAAGSAALRLPARHARSPRRWRRSSEIAIVDRGWTRSSLRLVPPRDPGIPIPRATEGAE